MGPDETTSPAIPAAPAPVAPAAPVPQVPAAPAGHTVQLVDRQGQVHDVPAEQAGKAVGSGEFGWVKGTTVPVVDPSTGIAKEVPAEQASAFLKGGGKMATGEQARGLQLEKEYGGLGHVVGGAEALVRGGTAGLSDLAAVEAARAIGGDKAAEKTRQHLSGHQEALGGAGTVLELVGAIAPMLVGDEAGLATIGAKVFGSVPRGIGAVGELAGELTGRIIGQGAEGLLTRSLQKGVVGAAKAIVEGGLWGAGQEISDATLQNRGLTAENVLAAAGHGALLAGVLGGTLAAAEPLAGKVFNNITDHIPGGGKISSAADEQYIRAISANKKSFLEQMKDRFGGENATKRIADRLRTDGIVEAGDDIERIASKAVKAEEAAVENLSATVEKVGAKGVRLEDALQALDKRARQFEGRLGYKAAANEIRSKMQELGEVFLDRAKTAAVDAGIDVTNSEALHAFARDYQVPIADLLEQRRGLERTINWQTDTVLAQGRKAAGRTIEDTIMNAGEQAAKEAGAEGWLAEYQAAKARYAETRFIKDVTEDAATAKLRNRAISPSDYAAGMMGSVLGHGSGHALAGGIGGMVMGAAHHVVRERGNATIAVLLDKLGTFGGLSEMHTASMGRLDSTIGNAFSTAPKVAKAATRKATADYSHERFEKEADRISRLVAHQGVDAHLQKQTAPIANHAPDVAAEVNKKAGAALRYLGTKLPPAYTGKNPQQTLTPNVKPAVSKPAAMNFLRAVDAVEAGPEELVKSALKGAASLAEVDALKAVYPDYYEEAKLRIRNTCAKRSEPLPYQTAVRLGVLFDEVTDPSLDPQLIQQGQEMYANMSKGVEPGPAGTKGKRGSTTKPLKLATMMGGMFESATQSEEVGKS